MSAKIRKGDRVMILAGKDKGRQGAVLKVLPKDERVVVEGLNMVQRHTRPTQADPQGGIKHKEASLHLSNVAIVARASSARARKARAAARAANGWLAPGRLASESLGLILLAFCALRAARAAELLGLGSELSPGTRREPGHL